MEHQLEAEILAASQPLRVPGQGEQRVLSPLVVERIAGEALRPRWEVEAVALDAGVVPLRYLRNLARVAPEGQARLLRSTAALHGDPVLMERLAELLGLHGVGKVLYCAGPEVPSAIGERVMSRLKNRNASCEFEFRTLSLRGGAADALAGAQVVAAGLSSSSDEQLLQFACRMQKLPLVLGAVDGPKGQATTILPGDPGVALIYKPRHPHLEPQRPSTDPDSKIALVVASWLAEQVVALLLGQGELLQNRLHYADLETGEAAAYPL